MKDEMRDNLAASLHSTTTDLSQIAHGLADLSADDEIEQQAKTLDRIAEDANEAATILRALIARRARLHGPLPRGVPNDATKAHPTVSPRPDSGAS